jgi:hypothetical protein
MRRPRRSIRFAAMVAVAFLGACASEENVYQQPPTLPGGEPPPSEGWTWSGEGEAPNFGSDDSFCRGLTKASDPRLTAQAERERKGIAGPARVRDSDRRTYWRCLQGRGWERANTELR